MHTEWKKPQQSGESGQTLLTLVLFTFVVLLFVGLGIDLGFAYITRARLSKAVDAACLTGIRNYTSDNPQQGKDLAEASFQANYGTSGRDAVSPYPPTVFFDTTGPNVTVDVTAKATINTFFIRVMGAMPGMPNWDTLPVSSTAQATRPNLIMSLVLDHSESMAHNGGAAALPGAVSDFIDLFDDGLDRASMASFSQAASDDVTMKRPFKQDIKDAANALVPGTYTCSERGLTNGLAQNLSVNPQAGEKVVRVIVFFTDGMANTWYYPNFDCGARNISSFGVPPSEPAHLWNPITGDLESSCPIPGTLPSINGGPDAITTDCVSMHNEAQERAEWVAHLARSQGITIYAIGLGNPNDPGECPLPGGGTAFPVLNPAFLKDLANTPDAPNHVQGEPEGDFAIAANAGELDQVFQAIGAKILSRLTK